MVKRSEVKYFKISPSGVYNYPQLIKKQKVFTSDNLFSIGLLFKDTYDSFVTESLPFEPDTSLVTNV